MRNLQVGDRVQTRDGSYQEIYSFGHYEPNWIRNFLQISTRHILTKELNVIELTGNHILYNAQGTAIRADKLHVDDMLLGDQQVTDINKTIKQGVYLPLTADGTIVVSNLVASNYISLDDYTPNAVRASQTYLSDEPFGYQLFLSPYRMLCMGIAPQFCQRNNNNLNDKGILNWLSIGQDIAQFGERQPLWIQHALGCPLFIIFGLCYALEQLLGGAKYAPSLIVVLLMGAVMYATSARRQPSKSKQQQWQREQWWAASMLKKHVD
jgi:hypothetical protein